MAKELRIRPVTYDDYEPWMKEQGVPLPEEYIIEVVLDKDAHCSCPCGKGTDPGCLVHP